MGAFLRFLIIFIGVYYLTKWIVRFFFPSLSKKNQHKNVDSKPEGKITIQKKDPLKENSKKKNTGEYVDFEEIDE